MYRFNRRSAKNLNECHPDLRMIFSHVIAQIDCSVICAYRDADEQREAFDKKRSRLQYPFSKHNQNPSLAADVVPYPIDWGEKGNAEQRRKAIARFYYFAGHVLAITKMLKTNDLITHIVRWGGDWDQDHDFTDQKFDDLAHYELVM